jgi:hypothetical protein
MATFAIDFDGTIVEHEFPEIGPERPYAIKTMRALQKVGHKIIIWTCRNGDSLDAMEQWFEKQKFIPDAINKSIVPYSNYGFSFPKVYADVYLDDRSFPPFTDWKSVHQQFLNEVYFDDTQILSALEIANLKASNL